MECYITLKRSENLTLATTWTNPEDIMVREIGQTQKRKYCVIPTYVTYLEQSKSQRRKVEW